MNRLAAGLLSVVVVVLAGCTSDAPGDDAQPGGHSVDDPAGEVVTVEGAAGEPTAMIPEIATEDQMLAYGAFPLDAYSLDGDFRLIDRAVDKLVADCVAEQGFEREYGLYRQVFPDLPPPRPRLTERYGLGIMAEAQQYGYQGPPSTGPFQPPVPPPMSPALEAALYGPVEDRPVREPLDLGIMGAVQYGGLGVTPDSCTGRANAALAIADFRQLGIGHGSVLVQKLFYDVDVAAKADSRSVAADSAWSACVRGKGFDAPSPNDLAVAYSTLGVDAQIPAAVADVECKYATNYFGIRYGVESAYQQLAIDENFQELELIAAEHRAMVEKAEAVMNGD